MRGAHRIEFARLQSGGGNDRPRRRLFLRQPDAPEFEHLAKSFILWVSRLAEGGLDRVQRCGQIETIRCICLIEQLWMDILIKLLSFPVREKAG